jgi:hypothetical protein
MKKRTVPKTITRELAAVGEEEVDLNPPPPFLMTPQEGESSQGASPAKPQQAASVAVGPVYKCGYLFKKGGRKGGRRNWKRRWVTLRDDLMHIYEDEDDEIVARDLLRLTR